MKGEITNKVATWDASWDADGLSARVSAASQVSVADEPSAPQVNSASQEASRVTPRVHCRHYLPHVEYQRFQFITYRLYDSVPKDILQSWREELELNDKNKPQDIQQYKELSNRIAKYEDAGYGQCFLKNDQVAKIIQDNLLHYDGRKYNLINWCIMPNHVHVLIEVLEGTLTEILRSWRSYTAHEANKVLGRTGQFWMEEYFDRYIRDAQHFRDVMDYIDNNPLKAGLASQASPWRWCGLAWDTTRDADGSSAEDGTQTACLRKR